ncbi:MAG: ABC transporter ATP-binding protein [Candidatus Hydrogenedentota bacterium]
MANTTETVLQITDLSVEYKTDSGKLIKAVQGLNLGVRQGEVVGFIGPNGAGKSTTIKVLMGFRKATAGKVSLFGYKPGDIQARRRIGFLPEVALYYPFLTARETLRMFATLREIPKKEREATIDDLLHKVGLAGRDREPVRGFSKGMLQRVGIAQAIMGEPDLLILDEVTSGLDPVARYDVRRILLDFKAKGKTVFFSSHELSEVTMLCDRVILIDEGKVTHEDNLENLLREFRRHVLVVEDLKLPVELPDGAYLQSVHNGKSVLQADDTESKERLKHLLKEMNARVVREHEEAGSLEDFFVRRIGHKVT